MSRAAEIARITRYEAEGVMRRAVQPGLDRRALEDPQLLGIDEKSVGKGHHNATILYGLVRESVIDVAEERPKESAMSLLASLPKRSAGTVEAVAMDMCQAFIGAVGEQLPEAVIVFDRLHVKALLNQGGPSPPPGAPEPLRCRQHGPQGHEAPVAAHPRGVRTKAAVEFRELLVQIRNFLRAWDEWAREVKPCNALKVPEIN